MTQSGPKCFTENWDGLVASSALIESYGLDLLLLATFIKWKCGNSVRATIFCDIPLKCTMGLSISNSKIAPNFCWSSRGSLYICRYLFPLNQMETQEVVSVGFLSDEYLPSLETWPIAPHTVLGFWDSHMWTCTIEILFFARQIVMI